MSKMREVYLRFARPPVYDIHVNQANPRHPRPTQFLSSSYDVITARGGAPYQPFWQKLVSSRSR
jgi:hypothetical protein